MTQSLDAIRADWIVPLLKNRIVNGEFRGITLGEACSIIAALKVADDFPPSELEPDPAILHTAVLKTERRLAAATASKGPMEAERTDGYGDPAKGEYNAFLADDGSDTVWD